MKKPTQSPTTLFVLTIAAMGLGGCGLLRGNPVPPPPPPAPELAIARGDDTRYLSRQFERNNENKITGFEALTRAQAAVTEANQAPQAQTVAGEELGQAQASLADAQAAWEEIKKAPLANPERLAQVDHASYMATRWAEIALAQANVESGLGELAQLQHTLDQQENAQRVQAKADNRWLGQQLVPEKFGSIRFALGTAQLTGDSQGVVQRVAEFLEANQRYSLDIAGHTDSSPPSSSNLEAFVGQNPDLAAQTPEEKASAYNLAVSRQRAAALAQALVAQGIAEQRLSVQGFGQTQPIADNTTDAGRRKNRRVTASVVAGAAGEDNPQSAE